MVRPGSRACILVRGHLFFRERSGCGPKEVAEARARAADGLLLFLFSARHSLWPKFLQA
ncbi:hypothetical protein C7S15_5843 [Burkholderia cepacia]|nr:hypothetical protein [Burkholderia cepacia]